MTWWNPWAEIARLRKDVARLERECEELDRMATEAMGRAAEYYNQRYLNERAQHAALLQRMTDTAALSPFPQTFKAPDAG